MFDFFNNQQNPFLSMMNMMGSTGDPEKESATDASEVDSMQFMQQMFMMQMQFMQAMMMMPFQFMQGMANLMGRNSVAQEEAKPAAKPAQPGGFKLGNLNFPPEMIQKLMQMDMTPENLEKLQRMLDFVFDTMPESKDE